MRRPRKQAQLSTALEDVAQRLSSSTLTSEKRLALLRRQAELGDLRDELALRARRTTP